MGSTHIARKIGHSKFPSCLLFYGSKCSPGARWQPPTWVCFLEAKPHTTDLLFSDFTSKPLDLTLPSKMTDNVLLLRALIPNLEE